MTRDEFVAVRAGMSTNTETVSPETAASWLAFNTKNRPLNKRHVAALADAMTSGHWRENGGTIRFAKDGTLLDGQHRLAAVVASGVTIRTLVVRGLDPEVFDTIDTIMEDRTGADLLALRGYKNTHALRSAAYWLRRHERGTASRVGDSARMTAPEALRVIEQHPGLVDSLSMYVGLKIKFVRSMAAAAHYLFAKVDREEADRWIMDLATGADLSTGDPVYQLREKLIRGGMPRAENTWALLVKSWNLRRDGRRVRSMQVRVVGSARSSGDIRGLG